MPIQLRRAALLSLVVLLIAAASSSRYDVSPSDSTVMFTISKWTVFKKEGRFHEFEGDIDNHPDRPQETRVSFAVRVASVDTKKQTRDEKLLSEDFFHAEKYPAMTFTSTSVTASDERTLQVTGDLTIRGITKRITVPVTVLGVTTVDDPPACLAGFETTFVIDRTDFGVLGTAGAAGSTSSVATHGAPHRQRTCSLGGSLRGPAASRAGNG